MKKLYKTFLLLLICYSLSECKTSKIETTNKSLPDSTNKSAATERTEPTVQILNFEDHAFKKNIKTVQLHEASWELSPAIIQLGSAQQLKLSFDDLDGDLKNYYYTFVHCTSDWQSSELSQFDYLQGFSENPITDYKYSYNTLQKYTHYNLLFPNENIHLTKSGNYILKVFSDSDPEKIVLIKRFIIYEDKVTVHARVKEPTMINDRNYKQEIDFNILHENYDISNPYGDLKIVITQNGRWDNAIRNLKPLFIKNNELVYDYDQENVFNGGNEFRFFDIKSLRYQSEKIKKVTKDSLQNQVYLVTDEKRSFKRYSSETDINGKYLIKVQEGNDSEREADYAWVNFFLDFDTPLADGNLYLIGNLSQWGFKEEFELKYNYKRLGYDATVYLKQGYYNYQFAFFDDKQKTGDEVLIEGNHFETENDYTIYVYHKATGANYERLIAVKKMNSLRNH
jgi:hypothetical protein